MHAVVDIRTRMIIDYRVTDSVAVNISGLYAMIRRLGLGTTGFVWILHTWQGTCAT